METVTISKEHYECLRGHLEAATNIFNSLVVGGSFPKNKTPNRPPKETKSQKVNKYKDLIETGQRLKKTNQLKK